MTAHQLSPTFVSALKDWRKHRKMSQLELALAANVSQRHVSWLETGKSKPSREMVVRLTDALNVPMRERNQLLNLAGFASLYKQRNLTEPSMQSVSLVLKDMLKHHEPYPAFVLDRHWNIQLQNQAATSLFSVVGNADEIWRQISDANEQNIALLTVHPQGLRQFISNWHELVGPFMARLKREALEYGDQELINRYRQLEQFTGEIPQELGADNLLPILPVELDLNGTKLSLCSVISTFGTAQDITANELRIESFYPANEQSREILLAIAAQ